MGLGSYQVQVDAALAEMRNDNIIERIWNKDHTVWNPDPTEIDNRLGWLSSHKTMQVMDVRIQRFVDSIRELGYTNALLLGMGGSSLAPEVFRKTFGVKDGYLDLDVLDSTDPGAVLAYDHQLDLAKTLFIVSTKSGGTAETLSFFKYFYNRVAETVGQAGAGAHFIAITDPGSKLEDIAEKYNFHSTFANDPNIGGRYSALSYFGIIPAALIGVDLKALFERVEAAATNAALSGEGNTSALLGAVMGELAQAGRDKVTLMTSPAIASFGDWVEQLIAESTGKDGKGILPVVGEPSGTPDNYGADRLFVYLKLADDDTHDAAVKALEEAGQPVMTLPLSDVYDLGAQMFVWEMATVVAGHIINIQPFDQPNVESAKVVARQMIAEYEETGKLPELAPALESGDVKVYGEVSATTPGEALHNFVNQGGDGAYIALQAYIQPTAEAESALQDLRLKLRNQTRRATTLGFGPRFLHSTGQLHKGDAGNGLFIQFTADSPQDVDIPDEAGESASAMSFGTLELAQALGDRQALLDNDRRVIRFHLGADAVGEIKRLADALGS
jgi:glucose-6-phosphate isomerase